MTKQEILDELHKFPVKERIKIIEVLIASIKEEGDDLDNAAALLRKDYENNPDLTDFTALDSEEFYEPR